MKPLIFDSFHSGAKKLRDVFDGRFKDPRTTHPGRFVWDYWHVPGAYTHLRTPAIKYFGDQTINPFLERLIAFGQDHFACEGITPPWASLYVNGCKQEFHSDLPHGPLAWVYSLSQPRHFKGGETTLIKSEVLDFWKDFKFGKLNEKSRVFDAISPKFNRLIVFDPKIPHGVSELVGSHDPREGRLVIHGWFNRPRVFCNGPLAASSMRDFVKTFREVIVNPFVHEFGAKGYWAMRLHVDKSGWVKQPKTLICTVGPNRVRLEDGPIRPTLPLLDHALLQFLHEFQFKPAKKDSILTVPFFFE